MDKKNDLFAINLYQPDMSNEALFDAGFNTENTGIKEKTAYRDIPAVVEKFTTNGVFDEEGFSRFYDQTLIRYNQMASDENTNQLAKNYDYDPWDWKHTGKPRDVSSVLRIEDNPMMTAYGIKHLDAATESGFSIREIAQMNRVFDVDSQTWLDYTPNSRGLFASLTGPTLVLAQYDEDTDEEINGQMIHHAKGDLKFDDSGRPYYETIGSREVYDKDVLQFTDTLTTDGSYWNQFDFFDSDGLTKSIGSTILKNAVLIAPTLIPGVGEIYGALTAGMALAQSLPVLGKSIDGLITNDTLGNSFGRAMTDMENWASRFQGSISDAGRQRMWSLENTAKMISDVSLQLMQQRAISKIPYILSKNPYTRSNVNLAKNLSYAYMSLTSAQDTYSTFKQAGANDAVAGIGMLGSMGAYWTLMSQNYFKSILFKDSWVDEESVKGTVKAVANDMKDIIKKPITNEKTAQGLLSKIKSSFIEQIKNGPSTFTQRAISEGTEETMEEVIMDAIKCLSLGAEALGIPVSEQNLDFGFSVEDITARYFQSFVGGFIGGAIFEGYNKLPWIGGPSKNLQKTPEANLAELSYLVMSGRGNELRRNIEKMHRNKQFGSTALSGTKLAIATDVDGTDTVVPTSADDSMNQNDLIYRALMDQVNYIEDIINKEGFRDKFNLHKTTLQKIYRTYEDDYDRMALSTALHGVDALVNRDLLRMVTKIERIQSKIDTLVKDLPKSGDTASDNAEFEKSLKNNQEYKQLVEQLKEVRKERDELFNGNRLQYYVSRALFGMNKNASEAILGFNDKESFTRIMYNAEFVDLPKILQDEITAQYNDLFTGASDKVLEAADIYWYLAEKLSPRITEVAKKLSGFESGDVYLNTGEKYLELLSEKESKLKERDELSGKEKTEENLVKLAEINKSLKSIDNAIGNLKSNPAYAVRAYDKQLMQGILAARGNIKLLGELAQQRLTEYKKTIDSGKIVRDDDTLNSILSEIKLALGKISGTTAMAEYLGGVDNGDIESDIKDTMTIDANEFGGYINDFYGNLGSDLDAAIDALDKAVQFLRNNGFSDRDINSLMYGRAETTDGSIPALIPILPRIGNMDAIDFFNEIKRLKESAPRSFVMDLIQDFLVATNDESKIGIFDAVMQEIRKIGNKESVEDYLLDDVSRNQLTYALKVINAIIGVVKGSADSLHKFANVAGNELQDKSKAISYSEIDQQTAKSILNDLIQYKNKIQTLIDIDSVNSGSKLRIHKEMSVNMRKKFLEKLKFYAEPFKNEFGGIDVNNLITEIFNDTDLEEITSDNFDEHEKKFIALETALFDKVKELGYDDDTLSTKIAKVFAEKSFWKQESTRLSEKTDTVVSDYDMAMYMATTLSLHSNDFFVKFVDIIDEELGDPKHGRVPVYGQEYAVKLALATTLNQNLFNKLIDRMAQSYDGKDEAIKQRHRLYNMQITFGGAGTGKTVGVAYFVKKMLEGRDDVDILYVAMNDKQMKRLLDSVKETEESTQNRHVLFSALESEIFNGKTDSKNLELVEYKDENGKSSSYTRIKDIGIKPISLMDKTKKIRIMMVDEIATRNFAELKLLSQYAVQQGITILGLGDYKQVTHPVNCTLVKLDSNSSNATTEKIQSSFEDCFTIKTPSLTATMRSATSGKVTNYERLDSKLTNVYNKVVSEGLSSKDADKLIVAGKTELLYYVSDDRLAGDMIVNDRSLLNARLDTALGIISKMSDKKDKICIIVDNVTAGKYSDAKYNDCVKLNINDAQGGEYMYVFVDVSKKQDSAFDDYRFIYTSTQRSQVATVILDDTDYYKDKLNIYTRQEPSAINPYGGIEQDAEFQRFKEWRRKALDGLKASSLFQEHFNSNIIIPAETISKGPAKPFTPTQEPKKPAATPTPNEPIAKPGKPKDDENIPQPSSSSNAAEQDDIVAAVNTITGEEVETEPEGKPTESGETPSEKADSDEEITSDEDKIRERRTKKIHDGIAATRVLIDAYTDGVHKVGDSGTFYNNALNDNDDKSLVYKSKTSNATLGSEWKNIISTMRRLILARSHNADKSINSIAKNLDSMLKDGNGSQSLSAIWKSSPKITIRVENNGWFNAYVESVDGKEIIVVPIIQIEGTSPGIYTGKFDFVAKADYKQGDRITLSELEQRYPGLVMPTEGMIVVKTDDNTNGVDEDTKIFIEDNNGVSFIAAGMDVTSADLNATYKVTTVVDRGGKERTWVYNPRYATIMNIQRIGDIEDVAKYSVAWFIKRRGDIDKAKAISSNIVPKTNGGTKISWEWVNNTLTEYTAIDGWGTIEDPHNNEYFKFLNRKIGGFSILPEEHQKFFIAQVFNYMLQSNSLDSQWLDYISKFISTTSDYSLHFQRGGSEYRITIESNDSGTQLTLERFDNGDWKLIDQQNADCVYNKGALRIKNGHSVADVKSVLKSMLRKFLPNGIDQETDMWFVRTNKNTGKSYYDINDNLSELFASLFATQDNNLADRVIEDLRKLFSRTERFKNGFYLNFRSAKSDKMQLGFKRFTTDGTAKDIITTDATEWTYPTYGVDTSMIYAPEVADGRRAVELEFEAWVEEFRSDVFGSLPESEMASIIEDVHSRINDWDSNNFENNIINYLSEINTKLVANTFTSTTPQLFKEGSTYVVKYIDTFNEMCQNLVKEIDGASGDISITRYMEMEDSNNTFIFCPQTNMYYRITFNGKTGLIEHAQTAPMYFNLFNELNNYINLDAIDMKDALILTRYINSLWNSHQDFNDVIKPAMELLASITEQSPKGYQDIKNAIMNYLMAKLNPGQFVDLNQEYNEC